MTLPGANIPFVLLDDSRTADIAGTSLLFHSPHDIICARSLADVPFAIEQVDAAVAAGAFVAGWMAYECGAVFEPRIRAVQKHQANEPLVWMLVTHCCEKLSSAEAQNWLDQMAGNPIEGEKGQGEIKLSEPTVSATAYGRSAERIKNYIDAGDIYQANFTFPYECTLEGSPIRAYQNLRARQPVEFGALINTGSEIIMSFSPELFVSRDAGSLKAKPMKGTAARAISAEEDNCAIAALSRDEKSRAENLMIVDLIRNDLSRVAAKGSVAVTDMFTVETLPTLHQMTSGVTATAGDNLAPSRLLEALFPCGSVTGAPKIRAMEIIAELETGPRGVYCGAIGHFSPATETHLLNWSLNVPIRTVVLDSKGRGRLSVGSGIVADSNIDEEYAECILKAAFAVPLTENPDEKLEADFCLIETMRVQAGEVFEKSRHISRLMSSAKHFGIPLCEDSILAEMKLALEHPLASKNNGVGGGVLSKMRMTVDVCGKIVAQVSSLVDPLAAPLRVGVAQNVIDSNDLMRHHKTSRRSLYDRASKLASQLGLADILFVNERGEVAEGAISNIFIETADGWYTPPLDCGVLPGVLRAKMLETQLPRLEEKILFLHDLENADALYIGNALRGLRRVEIQNQVRVVL